MQACPEITQTQTDNCSTLIAETIDAMLPQFALVQQLNPHLTEEHYQAQLPAMVQKGYRQLVCQNSALQAIGVCGFWELSKFWLGPHIEIDNFVVDAAYRNLGLGKIMVAHIEAYARTMGCNALKLDTYHHAEQAQAFYTRLGFESPGIVMKKVL